jgi:hypothetical protein
VSVDLRLSFAAVALALAAASVTAAPQSDKKIKLPEQFSINAATTGEQGGAAAVAFVITVDRYNTDQERDTVKNALEHGGYPGFLPALRSAPIVGHLEAGQQKWAIRFARYSPTPKGRKIVVVTDQPVFFVGGGRPDAKPREGYGVAVAQFEVDDIGLGQGTLAAAARVKPGGETGVQIDDYADKPIELKTVRKLLQ